MTDERWLQINCYAKYEISNRGRVRHIRKGNILKPRIAHVYLAVNLYQNDSTSQKDTINIHRLVAIHFVEGRSEERHQVNHKDTDELNNRWDNLEWVTPDENTRHANELGIGRFPGSKVLNRNRRSVAVRYALLKDSPLKRHARTTFIGKLFGVVPTTIYNSIARAGANQ